MIPAPRGPRRCKIACRSEMPLTKKTGAAAPKSATRRRKAARQEQGRQARGCAAPGPAGEGAKAGGRVAGRAQRPQACDSPAAQPTGAGAQADRGTGGVGGYRIPAGYSEPPRLRARVPSRDLLHQAISCERRTDRARRRWPEADQRRLRARRRRSGLEGDRGNAGEPGAFLRPGRAPRRRRVRGFVMEPVRDRRQGESGHAGTGHRPADLHVSRSSRICGRIGRCRRSGPACGSRPRTGGSRRAMYLRKAQRRHES